MLFGAIAPLASKAHSRHVVRHSVPASVSIFGCQFGSCSISQRHAAVRSVQTWHAQRAHQSRTSSVGHEENILPQIREFTIQFPVSIFHSHSNNPYHNLAIENHILKNSDPNSRILFTYTNRPCVVFGRNQNPWLECNIARLQEGLPWRAADWEGYTTIYKNLNTELTHHSDGVNIPLDLVRRRSGGGTVIHDAGNLNFSFIVPNDKTFTRDKHAQLVVDMLREYQRSGRYLKDTATFDSVRVNERHDIVMTPLTSALKKEFKASGSAYKLTRGRALHHGTLLLSSPNILHRDTLDTSTSKSTFSTLLSSPAKPFLEAKGVGSVPSPVHNLFRLDDDGSKRRRLAAAVEDELASTFEQAYNGREVPITYVSDQHCREEVNQKISEDVQELMTDAWRFCQTPTFRYSASHDNVNLGFEVKQGIIGRPTLESNKSSAFQQGLLADLEGKRLHEVRSWNEYVQFMPTERSTQVLEHLEKIFPRIHLSEAVSEQASSTCIVGENTVNQKNQSNGNVITRSARGRVEVERQGENLVSEK